MRGSTLGLIGEVRKRSLFVQLSQQGWRKKEPVLVGQERPLLLWTLLSRRFGERPYRAAADELAIHPVVLRSIAPSPERSTSNSTVPGSSVVEMKYRRHLARSGR
jgi:hypothetical protein